MGRSTCLWKCSKMLSEQWCLVLGVGVEGTQSLGAPLVLDNLNINFQLASDKQLCLCRCRGYSLSFVINLNSYCKPT
jgi:hypothetical protein